MTEDEKWDFRARVVDRLRSYVGLPFVHQGRKPEQGFDCIGMPICAIRAEGYDPVVPLKVLRHCYLPNPNSEELLDAIGGECDEVHPLLPINERVGMALPVDFLLIANNGQEVPTHIATVTESDWAPVIIHTHPRLRVVTEHHLTSEWMDMVRGVYRLKVLSNG